MTSRRKFIAQTSLASAATMAGLTNVTCSNQPETTPAINQIKPAVISTWEFGKKANQKAWEILSQGGTSLDAVEEGVKVIEADGKNSSVGYGGLPDRDGRVTLDACIMNSKGMCGSVCALEHIMHPISVARMVMEKTPHVILVGEGALQFALNNGLEKTDLLTADAKKAWEKWKINADYKPVINIENHDTIGMIAIDSNGDLSGACTTSGLAYKMRGRVGDSPIIGAGLYIDNEVGGAAATGLGEAILRTLGSFVVVEMMRQGVSPSNACKLAIDRIVKLHSDYNEFQVGFIAMNKNGETGGYSLHKGFGYAVTNKNTSGVTQSDHY